MSNCEVLEHFGSWGALGALLGPRWAQDLSKSLLKTDFGGFWDPTWWILGPNLVDVGWILDIT